MARKPTAAELREENARQRDEIATLHMALMLVVGRDPDGAVSFSVGEAGERERYTFKLYGALRADGGTVVSVRTYRGATLPDVNAYRLEALLISACRAADSHLSDFNCQRRDALRKLYTLRNDLVRAHEAQKAS